MLGKLKSWVSNLFDRWQDRRLGVHTEGFLVPADLRDQAGCFAYLPLSYRSIEHLLGRIDVRPGKDVFVDYGSGLGRVPLVAARRPFRRVIGVELSGELHRQAVHNADAARPRLAGPEIAMVHADARAFAVPPDATVIYFFMPFDQTILGEVLDKIKASVDAHPRDVTILYVKPHIGEVFIEPLAQSRPWLHLEAPQALSSSVSYVRAKVQKLHLWVIGLLGTMASSAEGFLALV